MNVLIIYYSQTGNTQTIARCIRDGVREAGHSVYVVPLKQVNAAMLEEYDLIGLGSPIWCADPPPVRKFIESLPMQQGKHLFLFTTHGTMPDLYFPVVSRNVIEKGFQIVGMADWYGDCKIQVFRYPYFTTGHPDEIDKESAAAFGREVCRKSQAVRDGLEEPLKQVPPTNINPMQACAVINMLNGNTSPHCSLKQDRSKCLHEKGCSICQDNCPMGYIDLDQGKFGCHGDSCGDGHGCTYCEMLCPAGAIYAFEPTFEEEAKKDAARGFKMFQMILAEAEKAGRFRQLMPPEAFEEYVPFYQTTGHPRIRPLSCKEDNE